jgi:hypothetical protein
MKNTFFMKRIFYLKSQDCKMTCKKMSTDRQTDSVQTKMLVLRDDTIYFLLKLAIFKRQFRNSSSETICLVKISLWVKLDVK